VRKLIAGGVAILSMLAPSAGSATASARYWPDAGEPETGPACADITAGGVSRLSSGDLTIRAVLAAPACRSIKYTAYILRRLPTTGFDLNPDTTERLRQIPIRKNRKGVLELSWRIRGPFAASEPDLLVYVATSRGQCVFDVATASIGVPPIPPNGPSPGLQFR
jgi:hypothetical protein